MTLFLLLIGCVGHEFIDAVDSKCLLSLSIHWWFQVQQEICFHWWFMDLQWDNVFDNSMRQPWLYFCYRFDATVMNSLTLWITYVDNLVIIDDFKFNRNSVFADDLWICSDIAFLTIPCVNHDSIFAIDLMQRSWIHWHYGLHTSVVTQYSLMITSSIGTLFSLTIYGSAVT
jgi:hypothetical protein